jgi:uncharacterized protein (DUF1330 family)
MIFDLKITDPQAWEEYRRVAGPLMIAAGGKFIVRGEKVEVLAGDWKPATVSVVEFPSFEAAHDFYHSEAYQKTLPLRERAAQGSGILVGSTPLPEVQG